ncbi:MAG: elongation factor G [Chloroflexi bacterium]|nr:elongation factor G [Chloroflexota bacterium]
MADSKVERVRNVALVGHSSAGKTSLAEVMLFDAKVTTRIGRIEDGNTASDFDAEEIRRRISINTSVLPLTWRDVQINVLDTPGYVDFAGEVKGALRVADAAVFVVDAVAGPEVGTELAWGYADELALPRILFVNKMDRENSSLQRTVDQMRATFEGGRLVPLQLPIGSETNFKGVVDIARMKAIITKEGRDGDIPAEYEAEAAAYRQQLVEAAAEAEDSLIEKYLAGEVLTQDEVIRGLHAGIRSGKIIPVLCGSAAANLGVQSLMHTVVDLLPSPSETVAEATNAASHAVEKLTANPAGPLAAFAFKTLADPFVGKLTYYRVYSGTLSSDSRVINGRSGHEERIGQLYQVRGKEQLPVQSVAAGDIGAVAKLGEVHTGDTLCDKGHALTLPGIAFPNPVYGVALSAVKQADVDKMGTTLQRLVEEDPTLNVRRDPETGETILWGMGDSHIDVALKRAHAKFSTDLTAAPPRIPYRETIRRKTQIQGRHKKQSGGRGQFGDIWVRFEPLPRGTGFEFVDEVFGGSVPRNFIPAVEKGFNEIVGKGVLAGYPTVDFRAVLYDGSYHSVDSSEMAFKLAAHLAFKNGLPQAAPVLLEPYYKISVVVPEQYTGDVMGDLTSKRCKVEGIDQNKGKAVITAIGPLSELQRYATDLRSMTQGRGYYTMAYSHYEDVPSHVTELIVAKHKAAMTGQEEEE